MRERFLRYKKLQQEDEGDQRCICDLVQHPDFRRRASSKTLPTMMKNTRLYHFGKDRLLTCMEACLAHGWPTIDGICDMPMPPWARHFVESEDGSDLHNIRQMTGNGMHLEALAMWMLYAMAHTVHADLVHSANMNQHGGASTEGSCDAALPQRSAVAASSSSSGMPQPSRKRKASFSAEGR